MVNPQRGEVELSIGDQTYVLCAEMRRVASWCHECGITGVMELQRRLGSADPHVIEAGVRNLCINGDLDKIGEVFMFTDFSEAQEAIAKALSHGLVDKNPPGAKATR